ncbi:MAG TPA: peptidylprolyl isomerase [Rhodanobacteraceae bacterium]|nr:peptidylprolyl isomerase [Rhodanobacteraceae bacterium]
MKNILTVAAFAFFAFASARPAIAQVLPSEPIDRIIAVVDQDVVLQSELDRAVKNVLAQYAKNPEQLPPRDALEHQVLERLIMQKLQLQRADDTGVKVSDAEVDQSLAQIAENNRMDVSQLRGAIEHQGLDYDQFRSDVRDQLIVQRLRQRVVQSRVQVSDAEVENMLKNGDLNQGQLHLGHILIAVPDGATPDVIEKARLKADDVRKQIDAGMDFSAAAIRYSDAQNALEGGDLDWRNYSELPPAFVDLAKKMQDGDVSPPLRGPNGFHIIKLIGKRDQAAPQIVTEYHARHILIKINDLVSSDQAEQRIADIRKRIVGGEDFAKVAKEVSEDTATANLGGDMGWFPIDGYGTRVGEVIGQMKDNEVSQPFQTEVGWHIVQLLGNRVQDKTTDLQRQQARQTLANRKAEEEYESFLRQIRGEAYIDVRLPAPGSGNAAGSDTPSS